MLSIAVKEDTDKQIASALLALAGITKYRVHVAEGSLAPTPRGQKRLLEMHLKPPLLVVYNLDDGSVGDAVATNEERIDTRLCPAIPVIESWLFADSKALFDVIGEKAGSLLGRMPLPEQLLYPKYIKNMILREPSSYQQLLKKIDIITAGSRSPSLKYFLQSARHFSGLSPLSFETPIGKAGQLNREILRNLISEVYPSTKPLFRSATGSIITAEQMMQEITDGTDLGREYASDILRVARDLLARQAAKKKETSSDQ